MLDGPVRLGMPLKLQTSKQLKQELCLHRVLILHLSELCHSKICGVVEHCNVESSTFC